MKSNHKRIGCLGIFISILFSIFFFFVRFILVVVGVVCLSLGLTYIVKSSQNLNFIDLSNIQHLDVVDSGVIYFIVSCGLVALGLVVLCSVLHSIFSDENQWLWFLFENYLTNLYDPYII